MRHPASGACRSLDLLSGGRFAVVARISGARGLLVMSAYQLTEVLVEPRQEVRSETPGNAPAIFSSIDSIPKTYARKISPWKAPALLLLFAVISALQILFLRLPAIQFMFPAGDYVPPNIYQGYHAIAFRVFTISFLISFCMFWAERWSRRLSIAARSLLTYFGGCALLDGIIYLIHSISGLTFSLNMGEIVSGMIGFGIYSLMLLENGAMPAPITIRQRGRWSYFRQTLGVIVLVALSSIVALSVEKANFFWVNFLHDIALLGGIGPGVFLILPLFFLFLFVVAHIRRRFLRREDFHPDMSVIVPAFNEEYIIERTITALDLAAEGYRGKVIALIIDNNSRDATAELANKALARCRHITGSVILEKEAGKSFALNRGLAEVQTDFVIRVDADTQIQPGAITCAMSWFADARVGVVGGLPLVPDTGPFDRARQIETLVKHGFYSVALEAISGVVGVPGMFAVYRTRQLRALGGFVAGMNGEDTDISLRIAERGSRIVVDANATYISEVPVTLQHMREQRLRWFRSVFHISSRSRQIILGTARSIRGKAILPYMLVNSARRAMMVPLVIFGLIELFLGAGLNGLLRWQSVVAVILGSSVLIAIMAAIVNHRPDALIGLPDYFVFRFLRSYFTLESMLTIIVLPKRNPFRLSDRTSSNELGG